MLKKGVHVLMRVSYCWYASRSQNSMGVL